MGLLNMKERANLIGGELNIMSKAGRGTSIKLEIKVNEGENTDRG
jgi:signal transduction histidine kinase